MTQRAPPDAEHPLLEGAPCLMLQVSIPRLLKVKMVATFILTLPLALFKITY